MFWEKEYQPNSLGYKVSDEELQRFLKENGISFQIVDNATRWCAFAQCYAHKHDFDIVKATSFSYMISLFMTGMGISASTEMYFKEEQLEYDLIDYLNKLKSSFPDDEEEQIKCMFLKIFKTYEENISDYEYATERLSFKLTPSEMEKFQSVNGKNNKEKFKRLLNEDKKMFTVKDSEYKKELVKLGFSERLLCSPKSCKIWVEHCKKYNMKFLKGSYGTMVHKEFDKYFKNSKSNKIRDQLTCKDKLVNSKIIELRLDHTNLFKSKIEDDVYILTSSPYTSLNANLINDFKNYPYDVYVIHPNFLDYYAFVDKEPVGRLRHPLSEVNYAFTNASPEQMLNINRAIYEDLNTFVFKFLIGGNKNI